jgi:Tfp pilus assembly protein PilX
MLSIVMLLLGLGFLNRRVSQYRGAYQTTYSVMALQLAKAGLEEARVKLEKSLDFPPQSGLDQKAFSYTEVLTPDLESYTVTVDLSLKDQPFTIVRITSVGTSGPINQPRARRMLRAELDCSPQLRSDPALTNPDYFQFVHWQDAGSL